MIRHNPPRQEAAEIEPREGWQSMVEPWPVDPHMSNRHPCTGGCGRKMAYPGDRCSARKQYLKDHREKYFNTRDSINPISIANDARRVGPPTTPRSRTQCMTTARPKKQLARDRSTPALAADDTVAGLASKHLGTEVVARGKFSGSGWLRQGTAPLPCPACGVKHVLIARGHRSEVSDTGDPRMSHDWAIACHKCKRARSLAEASPELAHQVMTWNVANPLKCDDCAAENGTES